MKKIFKGWNLFEIICLFCSLVIITTCFFVGVDKNIFSLIVSLIGVVAVMTISKGLFFAPIINAVFDILYGILSITQRYYGEAIICFVLMLPLYIISAISWFKNKKEINSREVKINKINGKEFLYLGIISLIATLVFYFLLKILNTSQLIISTISLITSAMAAYLMFRRCSYYALGYIANDIILIIMWSIVVVNSGISYLPIVINFCVFFINDIYGLIRWKLEEKKHYDNNKDNKGF